jgi:pimeloyl-ACP methyl ester carboxylesterase
MLITLIILCCIALIITLTIAFFRIHNAFESKIDTATGIQENSYVAIGGIEQYMQIRGENTENPVILWLHGGPGFPLTYLTYFYQADLEKNYTVACFEQRGCGRTFYRNKDDESAPELTAEQLLTDTDEVVDYLRERFGQEKIILMGQSWGTVLGMKYINAHPEKIAAYVGVGQVTNFSQMKIYAAEKAAEMAVSSGNNEDSETLKRCIENFSETKNAENLHIKSLEEMVVTTSKYFKSDGEMSGVKQIFTAITSPEMSLNDAKWFLFAGNTQNIVDSQKNLIDYLYFGFDIMNLSEEFSLPIYFIQGENDCITPTDLVEKYYSKISAPKKEMIVMENAGHTPFLDNPKEFCDIVNKWLVVSG